MQNINQTEWLELISSDQAAIILDVRTPKEWAEGIIENALLLDVLEPETFHKKVMTLDKTKNYYIYCRSGKRSVRACQILEGAGSMRTYNLLGGWMAWEGPKVIPT